MTFGVFLLYQKVLESASSCEFTSMAGPTPMDKRPVRGARAILNSKKAKRKFKKINLKQGD